MVTPHPQDPILARFRAALQEMYGNQIERVVLFGSRARGDARPDSDYDVAAFLRDRSDRFAELYRLADLSTDILGDKARKLLNEADGMLHMKYNDTTDRTAYLAGFHAAQTLIPRRPAAL